MSTRTTQSEVQAVFSRLCRTYGVPESKDSFTPGWGLSKRPGGYVIVGHRDNSTGEHYPFSNFQRPAREFVSAMQFACQAYYLIRETAAPDAALPADEPSMGQMMAEQWGTPVLRPQDVPVVLDALRERSWLDDDVNPDMPNPGGGDRAAALYNRLAPEPFTEMVDAAKRAIAREEARESASPARPVTTYRDRHIQVTCPTGPGYHRVDQRTIAGVPADTCSTCGVEIDPATGEHTTTEGN